MKPEVTPKPADGRIVPNVCAICGRSFSEYGNNPAPFEGERACDDCNDRFVVPARMLRGRMSDEVLEMLRFFATHGATFAQIRRDARLMAMRRKMPRADNS
jgi:hypothetical protein